MDNTVLQASRTVQFKIFVSGTMVNLGLQIGQAIRGEHKSTILAPLAKWLAFVLGALAGGWISLRLSTLTAIICASTILTMIALIMTILYEDA